MQELVLNSRGLRLAAKSWGHGTEQNVLALHGWLDNSNTYDNLAPLIMGGRRVVAVDLPGHGASDHHARDAEYHFVDWVTDVMQVADGLGWKRFVLMGHSMGAGIATLVAGAFADRVEKLILLDGLGPLSAEPEEMPEQMVRHMREQARLTSRALPAYATREDMAGMLVRVVPNLSWSGARILVQRGAKDLPAGGVTWRSDQRLRGTSVHRLTEAQVLVFLRRIACPTFVLRALDGYPFDAQQLAARIAAIANAHVVEMAGGHHLHLDEAARVAPLLCDFLQTPGLAGPQ